MTAETDAAGMTCPECENTLVKTRIAGDERTAWFECRRCAHTWSERTQSKIEAACRLQVEGVKTNFFNQCPDGWYRAFARVEAFRVTVVDREMGKEAIGSAPRPAAEVRKGVIKPTEFWAVTVSRNGDNILTIETNCLSGKSDLSDEDEDAIRTAGTHLLGFIGEPALAQPDARKAALEEVAQWCDQEAEQWRSTSAQPLAEGPFAAVMALQNAAAHCRRLSQQRPERE